MVVDAEVMYLHDLHDFIKHGKVNLSQLIDAYICP